MIFFYSTFSTIKKKYLGVISKILFCYFLIVYSSLSFSQCPLDIGETTIAPSDDLLLFFPFDGDANNLGDPRYSASVNGARYVESSCGQGLDFDGDDDYVLVSPTLFLDQDYTVTAWINARDFADAMGIFSIRDQCSSTYRGYSISQFNIGDYNIKTLNNQINTHDNCIGSSRGDRYADRNLSLPANEFVFVALTVKNNNSEGRKVDLFVNCEKLETEMVLDFPTMVSFDSFLNYQTTIGASSSVSGFESSFNGVVDELRMYDRVLTKSELLNVYRDCKKISIEVSRYTNCEFDSAVIEVLNTEQRVEYQLYDITNDELIDLPLNGNCDNLFFFTPRIDTSTMYSIIATSTTSSCSVRLDSVITLNPSKVNGVSAGLDRMLSFCSESGTIDLEDYIEGGDAGGTWYPLRRIDVIPDNSGKYIYIVQDSCKSDTAEFHVTIPQTPILTLEGPDLLCFGQGGTISLEGETFLVDSMIWNTGSTDSFVVVENSGLYMINYWYGQGCHQSDSLFVEVNEQNLISDSIFLCKGDTTIWRSNLITMPGQYQEIVVSDTDCDTLFLLDVQERNTVEIIKNLELCEGDVSAP